MLYWSVGAAFIFMDITNKPSFFLKFKTQPLEHVPLDKWKFFKASMRVLFNQIFVGIPYTYLLFQLSKIVVMPGLRVVSTFQKLLLDLVVMGVVYEIGFYYSHRIMHHRLLYKHIHKVHHEWTAPVSVMANYAHWIGLWFSQELYQLWLIDFFLEHIFSNLTPVVISIVAVNAPLSTSWVWFTMTIITTLGDHSGYHLPFLHSPEFHDYHHLKSNECYGTGVFLDRFHKTSKRFDQSIHFLRHRTLYTFKAANELYPGEVNNNGIKAD